MNSLFLRLAVTYILLFVFQSVGAQFYFSSHENFKFKNYTIFDGLPSTSVKAIAQDDKGFLWFGTKNGLSRFDGMTFKNYYRIYGDSHSLSHNQIQALHFSNKGNLWIGTTKGLDFYNDNTGIRKSELKLTIPESIHGKAVKSISEDKEGNIWLCTPYGIAKYNPESKKTKQYFVEENSKNSLSSNITKSIYVDSKDNIWVLNDVGVDRFNKSQNIFTNYDIGKKNIKSTEKFAGCIYEDVQGNVCIGDSTGLWIFNSEKNVFEKHNGENNLLKNTYIRSIEEHGDNLLIGTYSGLYIYNPKKNKTRQIRHNELDPYSINTNSIYSICKDKAGNFWFGTWASGIYYLDMNLGVFKHYSKFLGLSYPIVSGFAEDANKNIWIGTEGGGVNFYNRKTGKFTSYIHQNSKKNSLSEDNVHDLIFYEKDKLLVATYGGGLNVVDITDINNPKFKCYKNNPNNPYSLKSDYLQSLFQDSKGRIWVGTSIDGIQQFNPEKGTFTYFTHNKDPMNRIMTISENTDSKILVGTNNGLGIIDGLNHMIDYTFFDILNKEIDSNILYIHQDTNEDYWIATEGEGLFYINKSRTELKRYNKKDGLPNDVVYGVVANGKNELWLSTHNGISKFNKVTENFENFSVHDGLQSNEFNYNAANSLTSGELIFGGVNGFNIFRPDKIKKSNISYPIIITDIKIAEKSIKEKDDKSLCNILKTKQEITFTSDQTIFSFDFVAFDYSQPQRIKYSYFLEGFNEDWIDLENKGSVRFVNLPAGNYKLKLRANSGGASQDIAKLTEIKVNVLPPAWKSVWAYLGYFIILGMIGYAVYYNIKLRNIDRKALEEERINREKDEELHEMKLKFFTNVSHELRTPLTLIIGPLEKLKSEKIKLNKVIRSEIDLIHNNAKKLLRHVNNLMDFRKDEMGKLRLKAAKGEFISFAKETFLSFKQLAESKNIDYSFSSDISSQNLYFDREKVEIIIYNLLSNAFKFTPEGGSVKVNIFNPESIEEDTKKIIGISFKDNGKGISSNSIDQIFERYYQIDSSKPEPKGSGIGLAITKRFIELHQGNISVDSKEGEGTCFTLTLPLGKSHLQESEIYTAKGREDELFVYDNEGEELQGETKKETTPRIINKDLPNLLVVEDNDELRKFIVSCFKDEFNIYEASDGGAGYEKAIQLIPDIIISDVMMPEMDGITLCTNLKKYVNTSHIPIILLTARTSLVFKKNGLETGADDYITKPFKPDILQLKVQNLLDSRKKLQEFFVRNHKINPTEVVVTSKDDEFLQRAVDCVESNLSNSEFNVSVFIQEIGMSRSVLFKKIKGLTGLSTTEFIRTIRIKRAAQFLSQDFGSISEVAYKVGFNDLKYFRTCFRKQFNSSPTEFIAKQKEKAKTEVID